ncbi:MAG: chemotaxis response regulator protein-glutamate methylesterase [Lentisphaerota bacterium]
MRIAIVNDMRLAVEALRRVVTSVPGYEVAWIALNGSEAVERCAKDVPDIILMDLIMPVLDGVEATRKIMLASPCAILVVTATVAGNAGKVFDAMGYGALDAVCTPILGPQGKIEGGGPLLAKIATISRLTSKSQPAEMDSAGKLARASGGQVVLPLVAIGASTGGPKALAETLEGIAPDVGCSIVVVQHVDEQFAPGLADWLNSQCSMPVELIKPGDVPRLGVVHLTASNDHLVLSPDRKFMYTPEPRQCAYRPSVDAFFQSLLSQWPSRDLAVLLTGMGRDGAKGLLDLRKAGWHTIAQDEASSIMYGMPKAAAELNAAVEILPPLLIKAAILRFAHKRKGPP